MEINGKTRAAIRAYQRLRALEAKKAMLDRQVLAAKAKLARAEGRLNGGELWRYRRLREEGEPARGVKPARTPAERNGASTLDET